MSVPNDPMIFRRARRNPLQFSIGDGRQPDRRRFDGRGGTGAAAPEQPLTLDVATVSARTLLDKAMSLFREGPQAAGPAMLALQSGLGSIRSTAEPEAWQAVVAMCLAHPVAQVVWQDPFTSHSFRKPRGYSGDAQLLDYLYGLSDAPAGTTPLGASVFGHMMCQQGALSVRSRGEVLAELIDETAERFDSPRILSIACGHLREGFRSSALREGRVGEFVALDQDGESLAEVARAYTGMGVRTVNYSVRDILAGKADLEGFHFVYAAGLYDYLTERVAARLTRLMFDMLAPGGKVLVANFAPRLPEVAYMESFMDWKLIYRTPEQMAVLSDHIPGDAWASHRLFWDAHGNIIFLDLVKRGTAGRTARGARATRAAGLVRDLGAPAVGLGAGPGDVPNKREMPREADLVSGPRPVGAGAAQPSGV